jgi:hypothetical protein
MSFFLTWSTEFVIVMLVSPANKIRFDISDIVSGKLLICNRTNMGPSMEPLGISCVTVSHSKAYFLES